mmetsp:Transcript_8808/g.17794  ORF Transcript_8808/g.17794 Transcript_8808/m.17794 type:complete len:358 (-) Transcript_8808:750-1823(-)
MPTRMSHQEATRLSGSSTLSPVQGWSQHTDPNTGKIYLANGRTGETRWLWTHHIDPRNQREFLFNNVTGQVQWLAPTQSMPHQPQGNPVYTQTTSPSPWSSQTTTRSTTTGPLSRRKGPGGIQSANDLKSSGAPSTVNPATASSQLPGSQVQQHQSVSGKPVTSETLNEHRGLASGLGRSVDSPEVLKRPGNMGGSQTKEESAPVQSSPGVSNSASRALALARRTENAMLVLQRVVRAFLTRRSGVFAKVQAIRNIVEEVHHAMAPGNPFDLAAVRAALDDTDPVRAEKQLDKAKRTLMAMGEFVTQRMLQLDSISTDGDARLRTRRKQAVTEILAVEEEELALMRSVDKALSSSVR